MATAIYSGMTKTLTNDVYSYWQPTVNNGEFSTTLQTIRPAMIGRIHMLILMVMPA